MKTPYRYSVTLAGKYVTKTGEDITFGDDPYYFYGYVANWKEIGIEDNRNWRMGGFFRKTAKSHQFVKALAKAIRHIYYSYGVMGVKDGNEEPAKFHVDRLNTETQDYDPDYTSEFDFMSFEDERDQVSLGLLQGGVEELIKNNEDVKYKIPVSGGAVKTVTVQPMRLKGRAQFSTVTLRDGNGAPTSADTSSLNFPAITFVSEDALPLDADNSRPVSYFAPMPLSGGADLSPDKGQFLWGITSNDARNYLLYAETALYNVNVKATIPMAFINNDSSIVDVRIDLYSAIYDKSNGSFSSHFHITTALPNVPTAANTTTLHTFTLDETFNLEQGRVLQMFVTKLGVVAAYDMDWAYEDARSVKIEYEYFSSQFTVQGLQLFEVGKQLISKATGGLATFQSELLTVPITYAEGIDCRPESIILMSGRSVRGLSDAYINISIKDYHKICDVLFCAGLGVEDDIVKLEKRSYFFKRLKANGSSNLVANLNQLSGWKISDAEDLRYNEIHIGYNDEQNETGALNGNEEFNTTLRFTTSFTKNKNVLDLICPADASGLKIFQAHVKDISSPSDDNKNDNDLFLLQYKYNAVTPSVGTALYPSDISASYVVTGVTDTNRVLNIGLSPKRCLLRHLYWLLSHFYTTGTNTTEYLLSFQTTDRNPNLQARLSTNLSIAEAADIYIDQEAARFGQSRLFYPIYVHPETVSPTNYKQRWEDNRYGVFTTEIEGVTLECYPLMVRERNEVPKVHEFKLLLTAANTPTDLIR